MMLSKILKKHVEIGIMNKTFEGFLFNVEEKYSELILYNNETLFINNEKVCFIKVIGSKKHNEYIQEEIEYPMEQETVNPVRFCAKVSKKPNEFVMQTPSSETTYQVPTFVRSTGKE